MRMLRVGSSPTVPAFPIEPAPASPGIAAWKHHLEPVALAAGDMLFRQGDPADALFFIEEGELVVMLEVPEAGLVPLRRFGSGQCLGEMALYRSGPRTATVQAQSAVRLWKLTASRLAAMERDEPALALAMHRHLAGSLAERVSFSNVELKDPLARLAHALRGLAASDFADTGWDHGAVSGAAKRRDEVGAVAQATEFLVQRLHTYIAELRVATAEREAIESELRIAGQIQAGLLPPPLTPEEKRRIDFAALIRSAREAGGDLYDGFFLPDGRFFVLVGDVSGKGVPAAVFMALTAMGVRALARTAVAPGTLLSQVNRLLCERNDTLQFVTAFAAILNPATGEMTWANAGHPPPVILARDGRVGWLEGPRAVPLGVFEETGYATQTRILNMEETLLVYSDGVTEAMDRSQSMFGAGRLASCFSGTPAGTAADTVAGLVAAVQDFEAGAPQTDDITVLAMRRM